jgi:PiT family inorganic phosphate transporter
MNFLHFFDSAAENFGTSHFMQLSLLVWLLILLALTFDFLNGLHDAANSIATVVSTRVLSPQVAIIWAAFFNFVAFVVFPTKVAATIASDVIDQKIIDNQLIAATLLAACGWNVLTWYLGLPTSSSHALIGGMVGAALAKTFDPGKLSWGLDDLTAGLFTTAGVWVLYSLLAGQGLLSQQRKEKEVSTLSAPVLPEGPADPDLGPPWFSQEQLRWVAWVSLILGLAVMAGAGLIRAVDLDRLRWSGLGWIVLFIVLAPVVGLVLGTAIAVAIAWICRYASPRRVDKFFRRGQLLSAAFFSLGHGGNDAQKTMGIIFVLLIAASQGGQAFPTPKAVPTEVVLACHVAMGLGTLFGGWRIVKTMGQRIIRLRPVDGFCAETGAALTLAMTTFFKGIPISTTHTITGAIVGVGSLKRLSAVRWGVAGRVVWAWVLTIPGSAVLAALTLGLLKLVSWG